MKETSKWHFWWGGTDACVEAFSFSASTLKKKGEILMAAGSE